MITSISNHQIHHNHPSYLTKHHLAKTSLVLVLDGDHQHLHHHLHDHPHYLTKRHLAKTRILGPGSPVRLPPSSVRPATHRLLILETKTLRPTQAGHFFKKKLYKWDGIPNRKCLKHTRALSKEIHKKTRKKNLVEC